MRQRTPEEEARRIMAVLRWVRMSHRVSRYESATAPATIVPVPDRLGSGLQR